MEWLIALGIISYFMISLATDSFDALLSWVTKNPRAVVTSAAAMLLIGIISALVKGQVTATIYLAGLIGGLVKLIYDLLMSHESH